MALDGHGLAFAARGLALVSLYRHYLLALLSFGHDDHLLSGRFQGWGAVLPSGLWPFFQHHYM